MTYFNEMQAQKHIRYIMLYSFHHRSKCIKSTYTQEIQTRVLYNMIINDTSESFRDQVSVISIGVSSDWKDWWFV